MSLITLVEASNKRGRRKGKEQFKDIEDTLDTMEEYVEVPLNGNIPSTQISLPRGSLRVVDPFPPRYAPTPSIPNVVLLSRLDGITLPFQSLSRTSPQKGKIPRNGLKNLLKFHNSFTSLLPFQCIFDPSFL